jgi:hypothetical protein
VEKLEYQRIGKQLLSGWLVAHAFTTNSLVTRSIRPLFLAITDLSASKRIKELRADLSENITKLVQSKGPAMFDDFDERQRVRTEEKKLPPKQLQQKNLLGRLHNHHLEWLDDSSIFNWRGDQPDMDSDDDVFEIFEKRRAVKLEPSSLRGLSPILPEHQPVSASKPVDPAHPATAPASTPAVAGRKPRTRTTSLGAGLAEGFNVKHMSTLSRTKSFQEISAALGNGTKLNDNTAVETH